jgi:hypothetical protein
MDNRKVDNFTKEIISVSKLELSNPNFNKALMGKIHAENRKRVICANIKLYLLMFISIEATIIVLLNLTGIRISDIPSKMTAFSRVFENIYVNAEQLIFVYFAVMFAVILVIVIISRPGYSYSKTQKKFS